MKMFHDIAFVLGILIIVLVGYYLNYASFSYLEAMTDPEAAKNKKSGGGGDIVDVVYIEKKQTEATKTAISNLNIKEQRAHYTTINDQLEQWISAKMVDAVKTLSHKINSNAEMAEIVKLMAEINSMKAFKGTLDDCAKFIDSH
jgi:hypothetical protein